MTKTNMIPAGYMAKKIASRPEWLAADHVVDIYSVSGCISKDFTDYIPFWEHNGYWFFDSPAIIQQVIRDHAVNLSGMTMLYYEVHELEFVAESKQWRPFQPAPFGTNVVVPGFKNLIGYDVVTFFTGSAPECSPLSCNDLAKTIRTNEHCLIESLEEAKHRLQAGDFDNSEPGPFRIFAVYTIPQVDLAPLLS
jgi:hypothetical protein